MPRFRFTTKNIERIERIDTTGSVVLATQQGE